MSTKLQIRWNLPVDLANVAASILYRAEDPDQNKSCEEVIDTGSMLLKDSNAPFLNNYIDEVKEKGIYRYSAFIESHSGEISECATFVYEYDDKLDVTIITDKNQATVQNFGTAEESGNDLKYTQSILNGSSLNLRDLIIPNLAEGYAIKEVYVFSGDNNTQIDGAPTVTITEDTQISVVCSKQKYTITINRDGEYFSSTKNGKKVYKKKAGNVVKIRSSIAKSKKDCHEFDKYTPVGDADPYGQEKYDPTDSSTSIMLDQNYVLNASYKEKLSKLKLASNDLEIGQVSGEGEYSCFDDIQLIATPSEKSKFLRWEITFGKSKIRSGDPESIPAGGASQDPIIYEELKIKGNVNLKAFFTKVFEVTLKIMGPNGIIGGADRGSASIKNFLSNSVNDGVQTTTVEAINNPHEITATPRAEHRFERWDLISGNITGLSTANSSINILSDAELHAVFIKFFTLFLRIYSTGVNGETMLSNSALDGYDEVNNELSLNYDTVKPVGKYQFVKWVIDLFSTAPEYTSENLSHTLDNDAIVKLYLLEIYSLILTSNIPSAVNLTGQGDYVFGEHEDISISVSINSPTVAPAYSFLNWQSDQISTLPGGDSGNVTISEDTTITANVETVKYTLTVSSEDNSKGTVAKTGGPDYDVFEEIQISTNPIGNNVFQKWEVVSSDYTLSIGDNFNPTSFNLGDYGNLSLKAYFLAVYVLTIKYYEDGEEDVSKQVTYQRTEIDPVSIEIATIAMPATHEFDRWEVRSGNAIINQPNVFGNKTIDLTEDTVIEFHALKANELTLVIDIPGAASFSHGEADSFFRSTEDIDIELSLNNANVAIPTYRFLNDYSTTDSSLVTGLVDSQTSNTIKISGDVTITAHMDYVLYDFSATVDTTRGSIEGTSPDGQYNTLQSITLQAEPIDPERNIFKEWRDSDGNVLSTTQNTSINLADYGDLALEAIFSNKYSLNITVKYPDADDITTTSLYVEDSDVTIDIEASINIGYRFLSMTVNEGSEQLTLTDLNQKFTMDKDYEIVVEVEKVFVLSLSVNIPGAGSLSGAGGYLSTEDANIEATLNTVIGEVIGYDFIRWEVISGSAVAGSGAGHGYLNNSSTTVRISEDTAIEAIF